MDVVINSQIQSPLVRTLARTKGKSQSFTHNIADNVAPCSFQKIVLGAQNASETGYGKNYKIKIPQFGYLRDSVLKFTMRENHIDPTVLSIVQPMYKFNYVALEDIRCAGSYLGATNPGSTTNINSLGAHTGASDLSWFNCQRLFLNNQASNANGHTEATLDLATANAISSALIPQFSALLGLGTAAAISNPPNGLPASVNVESATSVAVGTNTANIVGAVGVAGPYTQLLKLNGTPAMWSAHFRLYASIYLLASKFTVVDGKQVWTYPLARMVWNALIAEPSQTITTTLFSSNGVTAGIETDTTTGTITSTTGTLALASVGASNKATPVGVTLPKTIIATARGGETFWVPKIPQFTFDSNGSILGVEFIPMHFLHPNDNGDSIDDIALISKLSSVVTNATLNNREFAFGAHTKGDDWAPWDWQTESYYYNGITANIAERVTLSTHNRPIQTIFPQETYARIQRFEPATRKRYLKMMEPRVSVSGKSGVADKSGEKVAYMPLFLASTENPSLNFDTRFVEQLDIDVTVNAMTNIFSGADVVQQKQSLWDLTSWFENLRTTLFGMEYIGVKSGVTQIGPVRTITWLTGDVNASAGTHSANTAATSLRTNLAKPGAIGDYPTDFATYNLVTPRSYVISLRSFITVPANWLKVEVLGFFHSFHDATSQAIRDSNFKPGTPASLLQYNTYLESVRPIKLDELQLSKEIHTVLTTNNLIFGTTFFVRRSSTSPLLNNKRDHLLQTLPIKKVTLTGSGQQLYSAEYDEAQLTDPFDYDLASGKLGRKYNNTLVAQGISDPWGGEPFYIYHIPYCFSGDMTYNSGSIAMQTVNNPVLSVTVDVGKEASRPFVLSGDATKTEWELVVFHNYWQMLRIDSNTGSITRSLDL